MYNTGSIHRQDNPDASRPIDRNDQDDIEAQVLDMFSEDPTQSTRSAGRQIGTNHMRVWKILKESGQQPYHYLRVQSLMPGDYIARVEFCQWVRDKVQEDGEFLKRVLFTDECSFTRTGLFNCHNEHIWSSDNPLAIKESHFQHRWRINVWAGILDDKIIGPYFLNNIMNGPNYLRFLEEDLEEELDQLSLQLRTSMWYQHDGAPPHFARAVREHLNAEFTQRWIGRAGTVAWPARSPDLTPLDFYLWGHVKGTVFKTECETEIEMRSRIIQAFNEIKLDRTALQLVRSNLIRRCVKCIEVGGGHIEQFLQTRDIDVIIN